MNYTPAIITGLYWEMADTLGIVKKFKTVSKCNVCGSDDLDPVFSSKGMPLTGIYIPEGDSTELPVFDQSLNYCGVCGHGQLLNVIDPGVLYDDTYTHRSSESVISAAGNDFFLGYLKQVAKKEKFSSILEIGCNDLYLVNAVQGLGNSIIGIDPIWAGKDHQHNDKTRVLGRFVEELSGDADFNTRPDLILSSHTFEHVGALYDQFETLVNLAADDCQFVIEVPSFDTMVKIGRFDQVFHQHIQYLSISSMAYMINKLGCEYIGHTFNYNYWGGTLLFSFQKKSLGNSSENIKYDPIGFNNIQTAFNAFNRGLHDLRDQLVSLDEPCYGFGAAQMLPVLAHYMETDLGFMNAIFDDNKDRVGRRLPGISCPIITPSDVTNFSDIAVAVTALDSMRPILKRLFELSPRRIISPIHLF